MMFSDGSEARTPELDEGGVYEDVGLPEDEPVTLACEDCEPVRRNPSPYYYGDLFRDGDAPPPYRKSASLDAASPAARRHVSRSSASAEGHALMPPAPRPRRQVCACAGGAQPDDAEESPSPLDEPPVDYDIDRGFFDMSGRRLHVYETAFDCRVDRSDDDLDDVDRVTNHAALHSYASKQAKQSRPGPSEASAPEERRKVTLVRGDEAALCRDLDAVVIDDSRDAPSPPSTAPLPAKFHGSNKDVRCMNSIRSAPNLPSSGPARLKDLRLPVKSLRARDPSPGKTRGVLEFKGRSGVILEFKGRPPLTPRRCPVAVRPKYSSTESMATSSSGGSLESIRSSTSEGNRSTSSSESRRSSSLSSHSSDSGGGPRTHHHHHHHLPCVTPVIGGGFFAHHQVIKVSPVAFITACYSSGFFYLLNFCV